MSLTANSAPFGKTPAGEFNFDVQTPTGAVTAKFNASADPMAVTTQYG